MNLPTAEIVRVLMLDLSLGGQPTATWPIFIGLLPDLPDNALCVYDTAGILDGRLMATGEQIVHPGFQVEIRGQAYATARTKAEGIATAFDQNVSKTTVLVENEEESSGVSQYLVHSISRQGDILPIGMEEGDRRRFVFTINAVLTARLA